MKLNEILLLELRDPLPDRVLGAYGAWIDSHGEIHTVQRPQGHASFLAQHLDLLGLTPDIFQSENPADLNLHKKAFELGFVRIAHSRQNEIVFMGMPKALKTNLYLITNAARQPDVHDVYVDVMDDPSDEGIGGKKFEVIEPRQVEQLKQFLANL